MHKSGGEELENTRYICILSINLPFSVTSNNTWCLLTLSFPRYHGYIDQFHVVLLSEASSVKLIQLLLFHLPPVPLMFVPPKYQLLMSLYAILFECLKTVYSFAVILARLLKVENIDTWDQSTILVVYHFNFSDIGTINLPFNIYTNVTADV